MDEVTDKSVDATERLLPRPRHLQRHDGVLVLTGQATVWSNVPHIAALFRQLVQPATGFRLGDARSEGEATIVLKLVSDAPAGEGYRLRVKERSAVVECADEAGLRWGVQTLRQLLPPSIYSAGRVTDIAWELPVVEIEDRPSFGWRGVLLDVARWYKPVDFIYRFIDLAAMHKLNVLHLHLTDDQGWRFEVMRYPRLTEVGAWRRESRVGHWRNGQEDGTPHGGFYTQQELRDIVSYAATQGITVVPEVDLPGHTQAAIAAYPELGNNPDLSLEVATGWGVIPHVLNVEESTVEFMCGVLDELIEVFPSRYVHVGGDECPKHEWASSARAQELMHQRGLVNEDELQAWFLAEVARHLHSRGRNVIGWDEIREGGIPDRVAVMSWRGVFGGVEAATSGHSVVMAPNTHLYFDQYQSADIRSEPVAADGVITIDDVYQFSPVPPTLPPEVAQHILGTECALWCEHISTPAHAEFMAFPRLSAFSEVAWGTGGDEPGSFKSRLHAHLARLDAAKVGYRAMG